MDSRFLSENKQGIVVSPEDAKKVTEKLFAEQRFKDIDTWAEITGHIPEFSDKQRKQYAFSFLNKQRSNPTTASIGLLPQHIKPLFQEKETKAFYHDLFPAITQNFDNILELFYYVKQESGY